MPSPTGIDYLGLLAKRRDTGLARSINYTQLTLPATTEPVTATKEPQAPPKTGTRRPHYDHRPPPGALGLYPHAFRQRPGPLHAALPPLHAEAVARVAWCIDEAVIGVVTGEVGSGKTVAVRAALAGSTPAATP